VELEGFIERLLEGEPWSAATKKASATPKAKPSGEEKTGLLSPAHSCSPNHLDTADFLIEGLTHSAPTALL
jgi:hypothetical protein